jgi:hypothetical protein
MNIKVQSGLKRVAASMCIAMVLFVGASGCGGIVESGADFLPMILYNGQHHTSDNGVNNMSDTILISQAE